MSGHDAELDELVDALMGRAEREALPLTEFLALRAEAEELGERDESAVAKPIC